MRRLLPIALVVLLVAATPGTAFVGTAVAPTPNTATQASQEVGTASQLNVQQSAATQTPWTLTTSGETTGTAALGADLGTVFQLGDQQVRSSLSNRVVEQRYETANSSDERQEVLDEAIEAVNDDAEQLFRQEQRAVERYANGEIQQDALLRELAAITRSAQDLKAAIDHLEQLAAVDPDVTVETRTATVELDRYTTPIRTDIVAAMNGEATPDATLRVTANEGTLVMERTDGEDYNREATRYENRVFENQTPFDTASDVSETVAELYPWATDNQRVGTVWWYDSSMPRVLVRHSYGELTSYIDSTTERPVQAQHDVQLEPLETTERITRSNDNVTVDAYRVPNGGPIWLSVAHAETGEPLDAAVTIADEQVATTGADGERWVTAPAGDVPVTVTADGTNVVVTVTDSR